MHETSPGFSLYDLLFLLVRLFALLLHSENKMTYFSPLPRECAVTERGGRGGERRR